MCTVTFVPTNDGFVLTSSRDEKVYRKTLPPTLYELENHRLLFPKDELGGGTWIIAKDNSSFLVLLNGAFLNHEKKQNYAKSRGIVLIEMALENNFTDYFDKTKFDEIEPFTIIVFQNNLLTELRWDGNSKYIFTKSLSQKHIWSSATLYNRRQSNTRKKWFEEFCRYNFPLTSEKLLSFHSNTKLENTEYGLIIERADKTQTVSITQITSQKSHLTMKYLDRISKTSNEIEFLEKI